MAKKIVLIVFGIVILLVGLAVTALGVAGLAVGGRSGSIQSGYHAVSTPTYAFVSNAEQLRRGQGFELNSGHATLRVDARNGGEAVVRRGRTGAAGERAIWPAPPTPRSPT